MDIQRNLLTISLIAISTILYFKWIDYSALTPVDTQIETPVVTGVPSVGVPTSTGASSDSSLAQESGVPRADDIEIPSAVVVQESTLIRVTTDLVVATINTKGGVIERLELRDHLALIDNPDVGFALLKKDSSETFIAEDGLSNVSKNAPNHLTQYQYSQTVYDIGSDNSVLVALTWVADNGIEFVKTLTFTRDSYVVDIDYQINNITGETWTGKMYGQFNRTLPLDSGGGFGRLPSYTGAAIYEPEEKYQKIKFDEIKDREDDELERRRTNSPEKPKNSLITNSGWVSMMQHYFVGVWLPPEGEKKFFTSVNKNANPNYRVGFLSDFVQVGANQIGSVGAKVYLGSKETSRLHKLQDEGGIEGVSLNVDYGFLTFIADPLFTVLSWIHDVVGNWGWSIILLTILIKLMFYPLSAASYRSMGKMKKLQPRMATLKERYKDDRQKFQVEMMAMYKKEKVNPAGGCLPILVQIPVFIALYWVLLESVEMRHAPFALWWVDLSAKDPYYVLPVLMGVSMFFMQKLNPAPMDDIQKKVMMIMPFALTFLFMTFPQGLVLYWVVNNVLTMAQQWFNYRQQEKNA
ncbi:MAG: YidC/Oxa1 family membrane protein insertase [Chitinophagales bacterium]|jgi:YidC/Oxa1 family membrane protein insertase